MTKKEYDELCKMARYHMERYYNEDSPEISDYEYDVLKSQIATIEKEHPEWISSDSPTQFVAASKIKTGLKAVKHITPMLSIQDVFSFEEVKDWVDKVKTEYPEATFIVEQKIDGLSMTLRYDFGRLILAETRGDGFTGEDITLNAKMIQNVPLCIAEMDPIEIRGEVYMDSKDFDLANERQEKKGAKLFANARNCAAGSLRQLNANITKERNLKFFAFNIQSAPEAYMISQVEGKRKLDTWGFSPVRGSLCNNYAEICETINAIGLMRNSLAYGIDGAVIKVNQKALQNEFPVGTGLKYSAGMIAFKYPSEEKEAIITDIELTVGRTGRVNPTAIIEDENGKPLQLCGTAVSRATLHNQDFIDNLGIDIGAKVFVYKSGDIIPKIKKVTVGTGTVYHLPDHCPVCGSKLIREPGAADIICPNDDCSAKEINKLIHFASKDCMDIKGLGEASIEALYDAGYLQNIVDIYLLKWYKKNLISDGVLGKEKGTENVLAAIEESKKQSADRVLAALGIPLIGRTASKLIMEHFETIEDVAKAKSADLQKIDGIGEEMANSVVRYFNSAYHYDGLLMGLTEAGVNLRAEKKKITSNILAGMTFCITGTLSEPRDKFEKIIADNGGKTTSSVSKKTTYLLAGENAGSKLDKAKQLGVKILNEKEFEELLK